MATLTGISAPQYILGGSQPGFSAQVMPQVMPQQPPIMTGSPLPAQNVPQTGLIGSEQALLGGQLGNEMALQNGLNQSTNTINQGVNTGINTLYGGVNQSNQMLNQGLIGSTGSILGGASGAVNAMNQGYQGAASALGGINPAYNAAQTKSVANNFSANTGVGSNITDPLNQGAANFEGFLGGGQNAAKLQADLTGANGQAAQQAAYAAYQSSPAFQYQMDQMQRATERSAAARGGALGGNVLMELQRNAAGIASQDYQNQFNNLSAVANQGMNAAGQIANLKSTQAGIAGNLQQAGIAADAQAAIANQEAQMQANLANQQAINQQQMFNQEQKANIASKLADLSNMYGINTGNLLSSTGNLLGQNQLGVSQNQASNVLGAAGNVAQAQLGAAENIANNQLGTSQILGQSRYSTGTNLAAGRTAAGNAIAQNASNAATNIGNLLSQQGINISNEMANDLSTTTQMIYDYGLQDKISNENLAAMIANITSGQATNTQNAYANIGAANAAGTMGMANAAQGALTQAIQFGALGGQTNYRNPYSAPYMGDVNNGSSVRAYS